MNFHKMSRNTLDRAVSVAASDKCSALTTKEKQKRNSKNKREQ